MWTRGQPISKWLCLGSTLPDWRKDHLHLGQKCFQTWAAQGCGLSPSCRITHCFCSSLQKLGKCSERNDPWHQCCCDEKAARKDRRSLSDSQWLWWNWAKQNRYLEGNSNNTWHSFGTFQTIHVKFHFQKQRFVTINLLTVKWILK